LNSVTELERFIKKDLNTYTLDNITSKISLRDINSESGDYFKNIIKKTKKSILARAEVLIRQRNIKRYETLRDYYEKHLEGKYPFTNYEISKRIVVDASLEEVGEFFKIYEEYGGSPEAVLDQIHQLGDEAKPCYQFLQKIHKLYVFCGDFYKNNSSIQINLEIDFDINKKDEQNTTYLMDRIFKPNNDTSIEFVNKDKNGVWYFGKPMEMHLRWSSAADAVQVPRAVGNDPDIILEGRTVKIQCLGSWSVLRFLQKYASKSASRDRLLPNQIPLSFSIPLSDSKTASLSVGVLISAPKKPGDTSVNTFQLPVPTDKMPPIPSSVKSYSDQSVLVDRSGTSTMPNPPPDVPKTDVPKTTVKPAKPTPAKETSSQKKPAPKVNAPPQVKQKTAEETKSEALEILESNEIEPLSDEEAVIPVSEDAV
jgi:hypothetical protein